MKYTAKIKEKKISEGILLVTIQFKNIETKDDFVEIFRTNQQQEVKWIKEQIKNKLKNLNSLDGIQKEIIIDTEFEDVEEEIILESEEKTQYKKDLDLFGKMVGVTQQGILSRDDEEFIALKEKLKSNFSSEYLDLF